MDQPNGHPCPECGAPRHADHTPTCACARRAADALRDTRTAEAAAAEDFDPLRIRPYVDLPGTSPDATTPDGSPRATKGTPSASGTPRATAQGGAAADAAAGPGAYPAAAPGAHPEAAHPSAHGGPTTSNATPAHTTRPTEGPAAHKGTPAPEDRRTTAAQIGSEGPGAPDATMALKALGPDAATPGTAAGDSAAAAGTEAAPPAQAAHTRTPGGTGNRASAPGEQRTPADAVGSTAARAGATARPQAEAGTAAPDATMTLRAVRPDGAAPGGPASDDDRTSVLPTPLAPGTAQPNADDLGLFDDATRPLRAVSAGAPAPRPGTDAHRDRGNRRRRGALIAASGAVVAVLGAAGWASGLFSYETPSRDTAAPDDVRASVPDASSRAPSAEPSSEAPSVSAGASASESPTASGSGSPSPSASASAPSASATASTDVEPSATPSPDGAASSAPAVAPEPSEPADTAPVLRRGDRGPEVVELQQRLRQVWLYQGDADGRYSHRVEEAVRRYQWQRGINEELGVYGPRTRARLESETRTP
ncbi:peptidoglycan-binding protein [Streptomyces cellulosae]|nr:peptidoglycan-binding protein [Streptomyces cellulosae]